MSVDYSNIAAKHNGFYSEDKAFSRFDIYEQAEVFQAFVRNTFDYHFRNRYDEEEFKAIVEHVDSLCFFAIYTEHTQDNDNFCSVTQCKIPFYDMPHLEACILSGFPNLSFSRFVEFRERFRALVQYDTFFIRPYYGDCIQYAVYTINHDSAMTLFDSLK